MRASSYGIFKGMWLKRYNRAHQKDAVISEIKVKESNYRFSASRLGKFSCTTRGKFYAQVSISIIDIVSMAA